MTLSGNITASALRTEFSDASYNPNASGHDGDFTVPLRLSSLAAATTERDRSIAFTAPDDFEVRVLAVRVTDTAGGPVITAALTVENGDASFLCDHDVSQAVTSVNGTADARLDLTDAETFGKVWLTKGVRYRLSLACSTGSVAGPVYAMLVLRAVARGSDKFARTIPRRFSDGANLDVDALNENVGEALETVQRCIDRRFVYSFHVVSLDGVTDASAQVLRQARLSGDNDPPQVEGFHDVVGYELVIYATDGVEWTVTPHLDAGDVAEAVLAVEGAGSTVEAHGIIPCGLPCPDTTTYLVAAAAATSTITRGYLVIHMRHDRMFTTDGDPDTSPERIDASGAPATGVNAALAKAAAAVGYTGLATGGGQPGVTCEAYSVTGLAGTTITHRTAYGRKTIKAFLVSAVGPAAHTARVTIDGVSLDVNTTGSTARVADLAYLGGGGIEVDPTDPANDLTIDFSRQAGASTIDRVDCLVFFDTIA